MRMSTPDDLPETIRSVRVRAAEILSVPGAWCQGEYRGRDHDGGPYCLVGACMEARGFFALHDSEARRDCLTAMADLVILREAYRNVEDLAWAAACAAVFDAIGPVLGEERPRAVRWNDAPGRTVEEVIAALLADPERTS